MATASRMPVRKRMRPFTPRDLRIAVSSLLRTTAASRACSMRYPPTRTAIRERTVRFRRKAAVIAALSTARFFVGPTDKPSGSKEEIRLPMPLRYSVSSLNSARSKTTSTRLISPFLLSRPWAVEMSAITRSSDTLKSLSSRILRTNISLTLPLARIEILCPFFALSLLAVPRPSQTSFSEPNHSCQVDSSSANSIGRLATYGRFARESRSRPTNRSCPVGSPFSSSAVIDPSTTGTKCQSGYEASEPKADKVSSLIR